MRHGHNFPVTPDMQTLAEAVRQQVVDDDGSNFDLFCKALGVRSTYHTERILEIYYEFPGTLEASYQLADALGRPPVTEEEKQQAFLDYVLMSGG